MKPVSTASNVEYTRASLNKKATTKPNYLILLASLLFLSLVGRYSSVGIATQEGLKRSGDRIPVEGEIFRPPSRPALAPTLLPVQCVTSFFPVGKVRPERGVDHPPESTAEVKQRAELYLCCPTAIGWQVLGGNFPLYFF
jgi:hypothetical protein